MSISKQGELRWTTAKLHTVLSETLLLGYAEVGDVVPVKQVRTATIRSVARATGNGITLTVTTTGDNTMAVPLTADTADEAERWYLALYSVAARTAAPSTPSIALAPSSHMSPRSLASPSHKLSQAQELLRASLEQDLKKAMRSGPSTARAVSPQPRALPEPQPLARDASMPRGHETWDERSSQRSSHPTERDDGGVVRIPRPLPSYPPSRAGNNDTMPTTTSQRMRQREEENDARVRQLELELAQLKEHQKREDDEKKEKKRKDEEAKKQKEENERRAQQQQRRSTPLQEERATPTRLEDERRKDGASKKDTTPPKKSILCPLCQLSVGSYQYCPSDGRRHSQSIDSVASRSAQPERRQSNNNIDRKSSAIPKPRPDEHNVHSDAGQKQAAAPTATIERARYEQVETTSTTSRRSSVVSSSPQQVKPRWGASLRQKDATPRRDASSPYTKPPLRTSHRYSQVGAQDEGSQPGLDGTQRPRSSSAIHYDEQEPAVAPAISSGPPQGAYAGRGAPPPLNPRSEAAAVAATTTEQPVPTRPRAESAHTRFLDIQQNVEAGEARQGLLKSRGTRVLDPNCPVHSPKRRQHVPDVETPRQLFNGDASVGMGGEGHIVHHPTADPTAVGPVGSRVQLRAPGAPLGKLSESAFVSVPDASPNARIDDDHDFDFGQPSSLGSNMMVSVPATQQHNQAISPNVSAMWKEWVAPDGTSFLMHEPSGRLKQKNLNGVWEDVTLNDDTSDVDAPTRVAVPFTPQDTVASLTRGEIQNIHSYGRSNSGGNVPSAQAVMPRAPRGAFSPTRVSMVTPLSTARLPQSIYSGKRLHTITVGETADSGDVHHDVTNLQDPKAQAYNDRGMPIPGTAGDGGGAAPSGPSMGNPALRQRWEFVRTVLMQGRFFVKHSLRSTTTSNRFLYLGSNGNQICWVPTSAVPAGPGAKYFGPDTRTIPVAAVQYVMLASQSMVSAFIQQFNPRVDPARVFGFFCVNDVTLLLECNTREEASYWVEAWNFYLFYSQPGDGGSGTIIPATQGVHASWN
eukprot:PhM_4_TR6917/c0_g1_i1/m.74958